MARESCNLDKDEAELLKASSSSPSPSPQQQSSPLGSLFSISCEESESTVSPDRVNSSATVIATKKLKSKVVMKHDELVRFINRCSLCRKKVGLTGFRCRCGDLFCGQHRYSDAHECSFDYKTYGREEIAKANPVIRAAKIIKI